MVISISYYSPFPYSFGSRVASICLPLPCAHPVSPKGSVTCPFRYSVRSIHYCRLSLNSCHNAVRLLFRCSLGFVVWAVVSLQTCNPTLRLTILSLFTLFTLPTLNRCLIQ